MNKIFKRIIILAILPAMLFTGCKKWLDVQPVTEVPQDILFENEQGFFEALAGVYIDMGRSNLYGGELTIGTLDALAQQYVTNSLYMPAQTYMYRQIVGVTNNVWSSMYSNIGNLNEILNNIDSKKPVFTGNNYQLAKGQALGLRAYLHFDLFRLYAPSIAVSPKGITIPYVFEYEPTVKVKLNADAFLAACHKDLDEAIALLSVDKSVTYANNANNFYGYTRNRLNYYAALALKARIALYQGDKATAYRYAHMVTDSNLFPLTNLDKITGSNDQTFTTEHVFALTSDDLSSVYNRLILPGNLNIPQDAVQALYENNATDFRFSSWRPVGTTIINTKFQQSGFKNDSLSIAGQMPLLRLSEQYYILAESTDNIDSATVFLNTVRRARGIEQPLQGLTLQTLGAEILKEYRKEFYSEGQLFFYYKRLNFSTIPVHGGGSVPIIGESYVWPIPLAETQY